MTDLLQAPGDGVAAEPTVIDPSVKIDAASTADSVTLDEGVGTTSLVDEGLEVQPQACSCAGGATCACGATGPTRYVYACGRLRPLYPDESLVRELLQAASRSKAPGPTNRLDFQVLRLGQNLHIARSLCFVLSIDGVDTYIVKPRSYLELSEFIADLDEQDRGEPLYAVIVGPMGPIAAPELCAGLQLPVVVCNQYMSLTQTAFIAALKQAQDSIDIAAAQDLFQKVLGMPDNAGQLPEHRAVNYLALHYPGIYVAASNLLALSANGHSGTYLLTEVDARPAAVQGAREIIEVILRFIERDTEQHLESFCKVDVTGQFPFLVTEIATRIPQP